MLHFSLISLDDYTLEVLFNVHFAAYFCRIFLFHLFRSFVKLESVRGKWTIEVSTMGHLIKYKQNNTVKW